MAYRSAKRRFLLLCCEIVRFGATLQTPARIYLPHPCSKWKTWSCNLVLDMNNRGFLAYNSPGVHLLEERVKFSLVVAATSRSIDLSDGVKTGE